MSTVVAILGAGDMGSAIGRCLVDSGHTVTTCLAGRSDRTRSFATSAGMQDMESLSDMLANADVFLSIVPPALASEVAEEVCAAVAQSGRDTLFVECNAISPATCASITDIAERHAVRFQDAGIIGAAPRHDRSPVRIYTSGPFSDAITQLATELIDVRPLNDSPGTASAIKMVYASLTKGTTALQVAAMMAGEQLGVGEAIRKEFGESLPGVYATIERRMPDVASVAGRWSGEMREIAATYRSVGLPPSFHEGAETLYELLSGTPISDESRDEAAAADRSVEELLSVFTQTIDER